MKSSHGAVLNDFAIVWGRFDRKWGSFGLGPYSIGAVFNGNNHKIVKCRQYINII